MAQGKRSGAVLNDARTTQHQLARDHRILTEDWVGYAIAVCTVLLFMILVGVLPVGQ